MNQPYTNGQTRYNNLLNQFNNPLANNNSNDSFQLGQNLGIAISNGFGKNDSQFGGVDVGKGIGDTDLAKFGNLTNNGTDFSKLGITDDNKIAELTKLYNKANL